MNDLLTEYKEATGYDGERVSRHYTAGYIHWLEMEISGYRCAEKCVEILNPPPRKKGCPRGFVARCRCGKIVGALDFTRTDSKEARYILGDWLFNGCTVEPRWGSWSEKIESCECGETNQ